MGLSIVQKVTPVKMKVLFIAATVALASASFAPSCEECNAAAGGLLARLTSPSQLRSKPGSSSPKFALRLLMPLLVRRVKMAELGLKKKEIDAINFAFDVYGFKGDGKVDAFFTGDLIRACNLNPTLKTIAEIGGTTEKGEKFLSKPDVFPMYKACKDSKDQGGFHDFVEILKLYDKNADDTILEFELFKL